MMNNSIESLINFFGEAVDLSDFDIKSYTACRSDMAPIVYETRSPEVYQIYSTVFFSIHAITHFDFPWCLDKDEIDLVEVGNEDIKKISHSPEDMRVLLDYYSKIRFFDAAILDLTGKVKHINDYLDPNTKYLHDLKDYDSFENLMSLLEIHKTDILARVQEEDVLEKFLIFRTGWDEEFNVMTTNLSNPFFQFRHPYLTPPFMKYETIRWLIRDMEIKGIACDVPGLDDPSYYTKPHFIPKSARRYYSELRPKYRPVSLMLLSNSLYYISRITNLHLVEEMNFGTICLIPTPLGLRDACPVKVYFRGR